MICSPSVAATESNGGAPSSPTFTAANLRLDGALERFQGSRTLSRADQLRGLVGYLREAVAQDDAALFTEWVIGTQFFQRRGFDPRQDTIVRAQMHRLRMKLDEYYRTEGEAETERVRFEKNSYRPVLAPPIDRPRDYATPTAPRSPGFSSGLAIGIAGGFAVAALCAWLVFGAARQPGVPETVALHPIWAPLRSSTVTVSLSTPLFFRSAKGHERNFRLNFPADLHDAEKVLREVPAAPEWGRWVSFGDVAAVWQLGRHLSAMNSTPSFRNAVDLSISDIQGKKTIVVGHPRGAPILLEAMKGLSFQAPPVAYHGTQSGFVNITPRSGELAAYTSDDWTPMGRGNEASADYVLLTSLRSPEGGVLLSVFGNRTQSSALVLEKLQDVPFLEHLNQLVFADGNSQYRSCQIVLRIDYARGNPIGVAHVTHRVTR